MNTFFVETKRLLVRPPTIDDVVLWYPLQSDPDVMTFVGNGVRTRCMVEESVCALIAHYKKHGFTLGSIFEKDTSEFVGRGGLVYLALDDSQPDIEIGYMLHKHFWGKGYATELAEAFLQWGFAHLPVEKLVAVTHPDNAVSQRVLAKVGFSYVKNCDYCGKPVRYFECLKKM